MQVKALFNRLVVTWEKLLLVSITLISVFVVCLFIINNHIRSGAKQFIYASADSVPQKYTAIVLGAFVGKNGAPSNVLADRLNTALDLYQKGRVKRFLLTGDHGRVNYDEVNNMKLYLMENGVPQQDIFLDHAGFDTYNSMVRAKEIFCVKGAIIITQEFHLPRAVYIARKKGLDALGYIAPMRDVNALRYLEFRENIACIKAYWEVLINKRPRFLGTKIPITGDSRLSYD
jgi:SanA protein